MPILKVGLIGNGYFGKNYRRLLSETDGVELRAIANNKQEAKKSCKNPEIDCLIISSPPSTHFALAKDGILEGKHVLVEKPMTISLRDARELEKLVQKSDKIFMVGHQYLYNDHISELKEKLDNGILGKIHYVFAEHFYFGPLRRDIGVFWDAVPHMLSIADYLFSPFEIKKVKGTMVVFEGSEHDDFVSAQINTKSNILLSVAVSRFAFPKTRKIIFGGSLGVAVYDELEPENKLKFVNHPYPPESFKKSSLFLTPKNNEILMPKVKAREPLFNQLNHFLNCVRQDCLPLSDIKHGIRIIKMLDLIEKKIV